MKAHKLLVVVFTLFFSNLLHAQIFINTGNPNLDKYKNENPNAVIWNDSKKVPIPKNTPEEPADHPAKKQAEAKKEPVKKAKAIVAEKPAPVIEEQPQAPVATGAAPTDYPPNAEPGKCYARCVVPDQFEIKEEQVVDKPAYVRTEKVSAKYEIVYDTVIIKAAIKKMVNTPAQFDMVTEDKLVTPATQKWVKGTADKNCLSANPKDCEVWCLKSVPAVYEKVTRKVEKVAAASNEVEISAVTKVVPRKKLVTASVENKIDVPATYKTVMKKMLSKKGGFAEWKEVLCEPLITESKISDIQIALKREGYDAGPIDNQMGGKTKQALVKFQQDKGLPVGNLNLETLKALGVSQ